MAQNREQRIRERAYGLWEGWGRVPERELDDWLAAEREADVPVEPAAGEEDPLAGVDQEAPGTFAPDRRPEDRGSER